ncbi:MAG: DUF3078 domain-containing protein [Balneolales bacterium]
MFLRLLFTFGLLFTGHVLAQDNTVPVNTDTTYWSNQFSVGLNLNQSSFSSNWQGGGVNSFSLGAILSAKSSYEKDRLTYDNELELLYGIISQEGQDTRKSNDRIFLDSKIGYKMTEDWGSYFSLNFLTQFTNGYEPEFDFKLSLIDQ